MYTVTRSPCAAYAPPSFRDATMRSQISCVTSVHRAVPPRSMVFCAATHALSLTRRSTHQPAHSTARTQPSRRAPSVAVSMHAATSSRRRCRSISAALMSRATGLARFLPAMSGAVPWTCCTRAWREDGSNTPCPATLTYRLEHSHLTSDIGRGCEAQTTDETSGHVTCHIAVQVRQHQHIEPLWAAGQLQVGGQPSGECRHTNTSGQCCQGNGSTATAGTWSTTRSMSMASNLMLG